MGEKIYVFMCAYNSENTIRASIESIKNQTYNNFSCYIVDHGSTDKTGDIINEYVVNDSRFFTNYISQDIGAITSAYAQKISLEVKNGYFITLDADDTYDSVCFEKLVNFAKEKNLDIVACGSRFIDVKSQKKLSERCSSETYIIDNKNSEKKFSEYHQFMRTVWGKLYKLELLRICSFDIPFDLSYGSDTLFAIQTFEKANKIGIVSKVMHSYYISGNSISYKFNECRYKSDIYLFEQTKMYLKKKCGRINSENMYFIYLVYMNSLLDTLNSLKISDNDNKEKLEFIHKVINHSYTQELFKYEFSNELKKMVLYILNSINLFETKEVLHLSINISSVLQLVPYKVFSYNPQKILEYFILFRSVAKTEVQLVYAENIISAVANESIFLKNKSVDFLVNYKEIVFFIINKKYHDALQYIVTVLEKEVKELCVDLIHIGLDLSSILQENRLFVLIKKYQILYFIKSGDREMAILEVQDMKKALPDDSDFDDLEKLVVNIKEDFC